MSPEEAEAATIAALQAGYRHIDTAVGYNNEEGVGRGIKASSVDRSAVFITSKVFPGMPGPGAHMLDHDGILAAGEESVAKLQVDCVDLYLIHAPFAFGKSLEAGLDQWRGMVELKRRGRAKYIGVSNYGLVHLEAIEAAGLPLPDANQVELHPLHQQRALVEWMRAKGITVIAYSSLAPLASWRVKADGERQRSAKDADVPDPSETLDAIGAAHSLSQAQVLLRWALEKGYAILPKSTKAERIKANMDLFGDGRALTAADMVALDALNADLPLAWPIGDPMDTPIGGTKAK